MSVCLSVSWAMLLPIRGVKSAIAALVLFGYLARYSFNIFCKKSWKISFFWMKMFNNKSS